MEMIIAVFIAVAGWGITHYLNIKAQEKALLNQIKNDARLVIASSLRDYQKWLTALHYNFIKLNELGSYIPEIQFSTDSMQWILVLEEYEILYPESRDVRIQLMQNHFNIKDLISKSLKNSDLETLILNQIDYIEYLRIYFQNVTLNKITGNMIPEPIPGEFSSPRIVLSDGKLIIVNAE